MKRINLLLLLSLTMCGCSTAPLPQQVKNQMQYSKTHTGYADAAAMKYALEHQVTPDSAVTLRDEHKW